MTTRGRVLVAAILTAGVGAPAGLGVAAARTHGPARVAVASRRAAASPIEHLVVVFDENVSFDHYFGTYPTAANPTGEPSFTAAPGTPAVDGLTPALLTANPNSANPSRLDRSQAITCDQDHGYKDEQLAFDHGLMDKFVESTAGGGCADKSTVMDYYDGNSVTGLWNLAQHFSMSDGFFASSYGPSTPGALNLAAGTTHGAAPAGSGVQDGSVIGDPDPTGDDCGNGGVTMSGTNIGDAMNAAGMTWGWFQGGFKPTSVSPGGVATCSSSHKNAGGGSIRDYSAHHEPFQYWASTQNGHHLPPTSTAMIGHSDQANHQYDLTDFDAAVKAGGLPQVSFLKAASFEDGHPGNSGPIDEQRWIARVVDELQQSPDWASTAIVVTYDDSDGWYDHKFHAVTNSSTSAADALDGAGQCGPVAAPAGGWNARCGPGPRLPLVVVSPWAKVNAVDSTFTEQASLTRFVEDNWGLARIGGGSFDATAGDLGGLFDFTPGRAAAPRTYLDPVTGTVLGCAPGAAAAAPPPTAPTAPLSCPSPPESTTTSTTPATTTPPTQPGSLPPTTPAGPPPPGNPARTGLKVTGKRSGRRATLSLRFRGLPSGGKVTAKATLSRVGRTLASRSGVVRSSRIKLTFTAKRRLPKGSYRVRVTLTRRGAKAVRVTATFRM